MHTSKEKKHPSEILFPVLQMTQEQWSVNVRGIVSLLKKQKSICFAVHFAIHRQHLAVRRLSKTFSKSLQLAINVITSVKRHALSERVSLQLCQDNDEKFVQLIHNKLIEANGTPTSCYVNE